jgi:hypothetical protein
LSWAKQSINEATSRLSGDVQPDTVINGDRKRRLHATNVPGTFNHDLIGVMQEAFGDAVPFGPAGGPR